MRLAGIKTKDEANKLLEIHLPKHNKKFSILPAKKANPYRKPPGKKELKKILCLQTKRYLGRDAVIRHNSKFYQIENIPRRRIKRVIVEDRLDGSLHIRNNGTYFKHRKIYPKLARRPGAGKKVTDRLRKAYIPPKDHLWKSFRIETSSPINF